VKEACYNAQIRDPIHPPTRDYNNQSTTAFERTVETLDAELSTTRALLMLKTILPGKATYETGAGLVCESNRGLVNALLTLQQKVKLLEQQYLLLRGDVLYMSQEIRAGTARIATSFKSAISSQLQEQSSLKERLERLAKGRTWKNA